mgnify:CR=1 FL=1
MEADNIAGGKEPKRLPVWACIPLFIVILFILLGLYGTLARGCLSLVLGVEARHPGVVGYIILEASMLLAVLTAAIPMLRFERRPFSDLGLSLKGHVKGLWYGLLMAILLYLFGFGISFVLGEIEVTGFQFKPLDLLGSWVFFLLVALFEEILMRGYILGRLLHTTMNKFLALFISAALFAFMHIFNPEIAFLPMLNLLLAGIFLASCFISLSIGTSVGTIVALVPVAAGIAGKTDVSMPFMTALVIGGAFFGDNLSFISDTTIAATRTQGCAMRDKFRANFMIAIPAALVVFVYYIIYGSQIEVAQDITSVEWGKVIPYLIVLGTAIAGINVMLVLLLGLLSTGIIGMIYGSFDFFGWFSAMGNGITGMGELIIITLMAGGMLELVRFNGGIDYILHRLTQKVNNKRGGELSIAALVSLANICTANNTIAIITVGSLANGIAEQFKIDKRKSASILDTFSCVVQGIIPYGAQMLIAAELTGLSPISIIGYLYYPMILGVVALLSIFFRYPRRYS